MSEMQPKPTNGLGDYGTAEEMAADALEKQAALEQLAVDRLAAVDLMHDLETGMAATGKKKKGRGAGKRKSAPKPAADQQPLPGMHLPPKPKRGPSKTMLAAKEAEKQAAEAP